MVTYIPLKTSKGVTYNPKTWLNRFVTISSSTKSLWIMQKWKRIGDSKKESKEDIRIVHQIIMLKEEHFKQTVLIVTRQNLNVYMTHLVTTTVQVWIGHFLSRSATKWPKAVPFIIEGLLLCIRYYSRCFTCVKSWLAKDITKKYSPKYVTNINVMIFPKIL